MTHRDRSWHGRQFNVPQRGQKYRVNDSKTVNATCIRTVFKMKSWNFTGTSTTPQDSSWKGWRFYRFPTGVRNKGSITHKKVNSTCIRTVFKIKSWNFTATSVTLRDRSRKGWRFYRFPIEVRNKGLIIQKTWIRRAFAQFSRWRVETSQERRRIPVTGRGRVDLSTVPLDGSEIKG